MASKPRKKSPTMLDKASKKDYRRTGNNVQTGLTPGSRIREWAKNNGLILPEPELTGDIIKDIQINTVNRMKQLEIMEKAIDLYKNTAAIGTHVFDELIALDVDITNRRAAIRAEGIDPLEDRPLQDALQKKFEMMKFLEKVKWDKEKEYVKIKAEQARGKGDIDDLFTIDAEYAYERDNEETEDERDKSE